MVVRVGGVACGSFDFHAGEFASHQFAIENQFMVDA